MESRRNRPLKNSGEASVSGLSWLTNSSYLVDIMPPSWIFCLRILGVAFGVDTGNVNLQYGLGYVEWLSKEDAHVFPQRLLYEPLDDSRRRWRV